MGRCRAIDLPTRQFSHGPHGGLWRRPRITQNFPRPHILGWLCLDRGHHWMEHHQLLVPQRTPHHALRQYQHQIHDRCTELSTRVSARLTPGHWPRIFVQSGSPVQLLVLRPSRRGQNGRHQPHGFHRRLRRTSCQRWRNRQPGKPWRNDRTRRLVCMDRTTASDTCRKNRLKRRTRRWPHFLSLRRCRPDHFRVVPL